MIRVVLSEAKDCGADAILRSVSAQLEADTPFSRELEVLAGSSVSERLQAMGDLPVGAAVITPGGDLSGYLLIHVVLQSADEPVAVEGLLSALRNGLRRAEEWGLGSVALPPLGTGAGNLEADRAAGLMIPLIWEHLEGSESLQEVLILAQAGYEEDVFLRSIEWHEAHSSQADE